MLPSRELCTSENSTRGFAKGFKDSNIFRGVKRGLYLQVAGVAFSTA